MHFDNKVVRTDIPTQRVAHLHYCGHTAGAGWMKTPLGTEVDLRAGHIVLYRRVPSAPRKGHSTSTPFRSGFFVYCGHAVTHLSCWALV